TITTRAVTIHMRRRAPGEQVDDFIEQDAAEEAVPLREALADWLAPLADKLKEARPSMPDGVRDRKAEVWRALLAIADTAGGDWPQRARAACRHFVVESDPGELSLGVRLLDDLRRVFGDRDRMPTAEILEALAGLEEAPGSDMYGKPIDSRRLAKLLGKYEVKSKVIKLPDGSTARGYLAEWLSDLWRRYLPPERNQRNQRNPAASEVTEVTEVTHTGGVAETPADCADCARPVDYCRKCGMANPRHTGSCPEG